MQNPKAFCYGIDAVLLADFAARNVARHGSKKSTCERAADLGTGTGVIPLILSHKTDCESIYGIELQKSSFELFCENIQLNSLQNRLKAINADIVDLLELQPDLKGKFDIVTNNDEEKKLARHESTAGVAEFIQTASALMSDGGAFFMIHRPDRLADIFEAILKFRLRAEILQFVATDEYSPPSMVLIKIVRGNRELTVQRTLYIYNPKREYSEDINKIYER